MSGVSFDEARAALADRVGPDALAHCERVATTAGHLAEVYGVDEGVACLAGLLHDWCRDDSPDELIRAAEAAGLEITHVDRSRPYLLHAHTAAAQLLQVLPGLSPAVLSAIEAHTMGREEMSDLDRLVYIADMLEPERDYPALRDLRATVGFVSLRELFLSAYAVSIGHLVERRALIHPRTIAVWNRLVSEETT